MAETQELTFPDLAVGQWWKLRTLFKNNLPKSINLEYIMSTLKISESTAANTIRNLGLLELIDKDGKILDRANDWRDDSLYKQVCKEIAEKVYPDDLRDIAQASPDRSTLVSWFMRKTQIGEKASHKNAAIFEVINSGKLPKINEPKESKKKTQPRSRQVVPPTKISPPGTHDETVQTPQPFQVAKPEIPDTILNPSVHIDIQIHISPDAPATQIEAIFTAIENHLYKQRGS